jgi:hypothetical protein
MSLKLSAFASLSLATLLLGCGPGNNEFAPTCPVPKLVPALADVTRYSRPGTAHDITDLAVGGRITAINVTCRQGETRATLDTSVVIGLSVVRGPAMQGRDADVPVFLAITIGQDVRDKRVFPVHVTFPPNVDRVPVTSPPIDMLVPVSDSITGASYTVIAGFQLTPDELSTNQAAQQAR